MRLQLFVEVNVSCSGKKVMERHKESIKRKYQLEYKVGYFERCRPIGAVKPWFSTKIL